MPVRQKGLAVHRQEPVSSGHQHCIEHRAIENWTTNQGLNADAHNLQVRMLAGAANAAPVPLMHGSYAAD